MMILTGITYKYAFYGTLVVLMKLTESVDYCKSPFGIKMCIEHCQRIVGCETYVFSTHGPTCYIGKLTNDSYLAFGRIYFLSFTRGLNSSVGRPCPMYARSVNTRQRKVKCIPDEVRVAEEVLEDITDNKHTGRKRLLLAPKNNASTDKFHQLILQNRTVQLYPYLQMKSIIALAYNSKARKLYIASSKPPSIIVSSLDDNANLIRVNHARVRAIAVDEKRDLLFLTTMYGSGIAKADGPNVTRLMESRSPLHGIAVDPERSMIFTCDDVAIYSVTYDGNKTTLVKTFGCDQLGMDPNGQVLYHHTYSHLMGMNIHQKSSKIIMYLRETNPIISLAVDELKIYATLIGPVVSIFDKNSKQMSDWLSLNLEDKELTSCLID